MHFLFAWRYFKAKKSTNAINIIAWISITAIIIGTTALVLVLSVFNGFEGLVKSLYSSFYTDLRISPSSGKVITVTQQQLDQLRGLKAVKNFSLVVEEKAFLRNGDYQSVVQLKGVDENYRYVTGVVDHMDGKFELGTEDEPLLVLGGGIENALGILADRRFFTITMHLPRKTMSESFNELEGITSDTTQSAGAFRIQQDFDDKYGITNLAFLKRALQMGPEQFGAIEISLRDPDETGEAKRQLSRIFGDQYLLQNRYEQNQSLYSIMNVERWVIYGVLCLILVIAAFNMIGALTMLVLEKQKDISVLHALGGNRNFIQRIFLTEGMLLAFIGGGIGMLLALVMAWLQINYHLIPLQGGTFLIDYYPVKLKWTDFVLVGGTVFVIALIASFLPSRKAAAAEFSLRSE